MATTTPSAPATPSAMRYAARVKADNRDSGVADMDHHGGSASALDSAGGCDGAALRRAGRLAVGAKNCGADMALKRTTLSNSLLDMHDTVERYQRRGSVGYDCILLLLINYNYIFKFY